MNACTANAIPFESNGHNLGDLDQISIAPEIKDGHHPCAKRKHEDKAPPARHRRRAFLRPHLAMNEKTAPLILSDPPAVFPW